MHVSTPRHRGTRSVAARARVTVAILATALVTGYGPSLASSTAAADAAPVAASWQGPGPTVPGYTLLQGSFTVSGRGQQTVLVDLEGARFLSLPRGCAGSSTVNPRSFIDAEVDGLRCFLTPGSTEQRTVPFAGLVVAAPGETVSGTVRVEGGAVTELPRRLVTPGTPPSGSSLRLLSSPDFLNADVGDLRRGPNRWRPGRTENSVNGDYRRALDTVLDDWASLSPDAVLVAGDLVDGWWGADATGSGTFGPVGTPAERRRALGRAARTYYPQWLERFTERGLKVLPAMGDHEYGDDPWGRTKGSLARTFERAYATYVGGLPERAINAPISRPSGVHHDSAYAFRPTPDVQLVTLNVFDITPQRHRVRLDPQQMRWLRQVLRKAQRDGVRWTIVQGHTPILWPVRVRGSSGLHYEGGRASALWKTFREFDVDLYLAGEVHDVTAKEADGITQITHGGAFQYGLTNYLVLDIADDYAYLTLRDYDAVRRDAADGSRLWETRPSGMPKHLRVAPKPFTIGTGVLMPDGDLTRQSGVLTPWKP